MAKKAHKAERAQGNKRGPYKIKKARLDEVQEPWRSNRIKELRAAKGWGQQELAEESGLSTGTIADMENGKTGFKSKSIYSVARALGVSRGDLFPVDPWDVTGGEIRDVLSQFEPDAKAQAIGVLKALIKGR